MTRANSVLDNLQIDSPCNAHWDSMSGNDEVRFCGHCDLSVYNISTMTRRDAELLVAKSNGKLCIKYVRRSDGSLVSGDQASGSSAINARVIAGTFSVLLTIASTTANAQSNQAGSVPAGTEISVSRSLPGAQNQAVVKGHIVDPNGALIPEAKIIVISEADRQSLKVFSDQNGEFQFNSLQPGSSSLAVEATGFSTFAVQHLEIKAGDEFRIEGKLQIGMQVCEVVQIQGGDTALMGIMSINTKRGFWRIVLDVVEFPYKQGKKIFVR